MSLQLVNIHPLAGYSFIERESQPEEDNSVTARLQRLEVQNDESGPRRSVEAIMLVKVHNFPHVLVLQVANAFYKLPGGYLDPLETDSAGLLTGLNEQLGVPFNPPATMKAHAIPIEGVVDVHIREESNGQSIPTWVSPPGGDWKVRDLLACWWRPNYDTFFYPHIPAHISRPKECKKIYLVELPINKTFAVPVNMKLHAIPIQEFYDNAARYGPQFAGIPHILSNRQDSAKAGMIVRFGIYNQATPNKKNGDHGQK